VRGFLHNAPERFNPGFEVHLPGQRHDPFSPLLLAIRTALSAVAWQHINLYGRYEFREQPAAVDVEENVRELADVQIDTDSTLAA